MRFELTTFTSGVTVLQTACFIQFAYPPITLPAGVLLASDKKSYRESHIEELDRYNEAIRYFKENTSGSVPSMKTLKAVKARLLDSVDKQKKILAVFRQEQKELRTAVSNVENILGPSLIPKKTKKRSEQEL